MCLSQLCLSFQENARVFLTVAAPFTGPAACDGSCSSTSSLTPDPCRVFLQPPSGCEVALIHISLNGVDHAFLSLLAGSVSSLKKCLFKSFIDFLIGLLVLYY